MNTKNLLTMSALGTAIMISYWIFIAKSFYSKKKIDVNKWWFGLDSNKEFMRFFMVTASLAAVGFLTFQYYFCFYLKESQFSSKSKYKEANNKILIETVIILLASLLWAPFTYGYLRTGNKFYKLLSSIVLGVTGFASLALAWFVYDKTPSSTLKTWVIVGILLFSFHTIFIDFGIWNLAMWKLLPSGCK